MFHRKGLKNIMWYGIKVALGIHFYFYTQGSVFYLFNLSHTLHTMKFQLENAILLKLFSDIGDHFISFRWVYIQALGFSIRFFAFSLTAIVSVNTPFTDYIDWLVIGTSINEFASHMIPMINILDLLSLIVITKLAFIFDAPLHCASQQSVKVRSDKIWFSGEKWSLTSNGNYIMVVQHRLPVFATSLHTKWSGGDNKVLAIVAGTEL